eukprot:m.12987 g.12987  ORF g.12987 m.12987 type:complete len:55 (-) comp10010_c0_seq1:2224-2388(-)
MLCLIESIEKRVRNTGERATKVHQSTSVWARTAVLVGGMTHRANHPSGYVLHVL